jgi:hypothetical protein
MPRSVLVGMERAISPGDPTVVLAGGNHGLRDTAATTCG